MENTLVDVEGMYYSNQSILYVGEGDFSFSLAHATRFGVANNIVATSLDSEGVLFKKYGLDAIQNIQNLTDRGAQVIHCVDVRNMAEKKESLPFASGRSLYDVVNYNFPHAGFFGFECNPEVIRRHTELMQEFFKNAALLLAPGGVVYVAHKCGPPYDDWNLKGNANMHGLQFVGRVPFRKSNFPGYKNRRGSGKRARDTFELGQAAIYMFALRCGVWIENNEGHRLQTPNKDYHVTETLRDFMRSFRKGGCASPRTPLLQAIKAEVARLEKMEQQLGLKKQRKLHSLKVVVKVVPLLQVNTLAIHQLQNLQSSRLYNRLAKSWSEIQRSALEAMEDEHEKLPGHDPMRDTMKEEQEVMEIYVLDDIANGALGEENEEAFSAFIVDTPMPCFRDGPEDIHRKTDHISGLGEVDIHQEYARSDGMGGLKTFDGSSRYREDVEDRLDGLVARPMGKGFMDWVIETFLCCAMSNN